MRGSRSTDVDTAQPPGFCSGSSLFLCTLPTCLSLESATLQVPSSRKPVPPHLTPSSPSWSSLAPSIPLSSPILTR